MKATYKRHVLQFKIPGGTSRGVLREKESFFLILKDNEKFGIGECGLLRGLSVDDRPDYEEKLSWICNNIKIGEDALLKETDEFPSIRMGLETAFRSLSSPNPFLLYPSSFTSENQGIPINGLVWMGDKQFMANQIAKKLEDGFTTVKMKVGAIDFETEYELLKSIRREYSSKEVTLRVDANGAFSVIEASEKLKRLSDLDIHSIEQPIKAGQWQEMAQLCENTPIPIALDEELIGVVSKERKNELLDTIQPQYIILKPSLIGGFHHCDFWIEEIEKRNSGWWITSALESNVGLNAIAQYTYSKNVLMPQGLGTGSLYTNNMDSPLEVFQGSLYYNKNKKWETSFFEKNFNPCT
ncbi:MAG TPA: o-succinylbenzoate synthase [Flavobacteriaceae bacterium]|nr:o-succinylbenzoate synthase [Flavobacteriaceae bacterium]